MLLASLKPNVVSTQKKQPAYSLTISINGWLGAKFFVQQSIIQLWRKDDSKI